MSNSLTLKSNKVILTLLFASLVALFLTPLGAFATDLAANAKQDVTDTFGPGSTAWYIIMVIEVLASAYTYIKTKNIAVFAGVIALLLFCNVAFGLFG